MSYFYYYIFRFLFELLALTIDLLVFDTNIAGQFIFILEQPQVVGNNLDEGTSP
jgi:hypothetical protein